MEGIHDAHVHAIFDGMVQKNTACMASLTGLLPRKEKGHIAHSPAYLGSGQVVFDPLGSPEKIYGIGPVLVHSCGHRKYIGIKDDVLRVMNFYLLGEYIIASFTYLYAPFVGICLAFFRQKP